MSSENNQRTKQAQSPARRFFNILATIVVGLLFAGLVVLVIVKWGDIMSLFQSREKLMAWIEGLGFWAPLVFILIQFVQVVIFVIPGEIPQIAGGYVFGVALGTVYSVIGIGLGSAFCFLVARKLGLAFVQRIFGKDQVAKFERFISSPGAQIAFFLLYLIPGLPKDILGYIAGLSYLRLGMFMLISMTARLPSLIGSMFFGDAIASGDYTVIIVIGIIATALFGLGVLFRKQITAFLSKTLPPEAKAQTSATAETEVAVDAGPTAKTSTATEAGAPAKKSSKPETGGQKDGKKDGV